MNSLLLIAAVLIACSALLLAHVVRMILRFEKVRRRLFWIVGEDEQRNDGRIRCRVPVGRVVCLRVGLVDIPARDLRRSRRQVMGELKNITPESLGRLAAHHELLAADPANMPMEQEYFRGRAEFYRSRQYEMLASDVAAGMKRLYPLSTVLPKNAWADFWAHFLRWLGVIAAVALLAVCLPLLLVGWAFHWIDEHSDLD